MFPGKPNDKNYLTDEREEKGSYLCPVGERWVPEMLAGFIATGIRLNKLPVNQRDSMVRFLEALKEFRII